MLLSAITLAAEIEPGFSWLREVEDLPHRGVGVAVVVARRCRLARALLWLAFGSKRR
jgi:hypothetical protein